MPTTMLTAIPYEDRDGTERVAYRTTVPEAVVELLDVEDGAINWEVTGENVVELRPAENP